jgi:hypothetical protein
MHAASINPEPGSNSQKNILFAFSPSNTVLKTQNGLLYFIFQRSCALQLTTECANSKGHDKHVRIKNEYYAQSDTCIKEDIK